MKTVFVHLYSQSEPIKIEHVVNTYTKDGLFCVMHDRQVTIRRLPFDVTTMNDDNYVLGRLLRRTSPERVDKFPIVHIFRITEETP